MEKKTYHEIFLSFPDVYDSGGPEAFSHLERKIDKEKNLIVVPIEFIDQLWTLGDSKYSMGASDALKFLDGITEKPHENFNTISVYEITAGLDLALVDKRYNLDKKFTLADIIKDVESFAKLKSPKSKPLKVITNDTKNRIN